MSTVDTQELDEKVQQIYRQVAEHPQGGFHFEMGRKLAERLGYPSELLDAVPPAAVESFAGVGYFFDLAALRPGERVLDLGSGSGTDAFAAAQSSRELEVLALVAAGKTNQQIAAALIISDHTVRRHLQNIFSKVGVSSRAAATAYVLERNLI
jgi:DNA-binding CsgD family transcriptional regulator